MSTIAEAEKCVAEGDADAALLKLQAGVRSNPSDAKLRIFLFQLLSVLGQWERALTQLNVAAELDASALAMAQMYREALRCEVLRSDVFEGRRSPLIFGQPEQWLALLIESMLVGGRGDTAAALALREKAFEMAPATSGALDGQTFEWIADADMRLGPVCEAVINGRYYWIPFSRLSQIDIEEPADLRDVVWTPAHFVFANGGETVGVIPTRYPGSHASSDGLIKLARKTEWTEVAADVFHGAGQRLWTTDGGDFALMDVRKVELNGTADEMTDAEGDGVGASDTAPGSIDG